MEWKPMRVKTQRMQGADDRVVYTFTATLEEKDLDTLQIFDSGKREFAVSKLKEFTIGRTLTASHDFNEAMCSKCKYPKHSLPVYYVQVLSALPTVAMYDEVPDILNGVIGKFNPYFKKWEECLPLVNAWAATIEKNFFVFANCTFFDQGYGKGNQEREFSLDLAARSFVETGAEDAVKEEPEVKTEEKEAPGPQQEATDSERLVPETMAGIWKLLGPTYSSKYDFGKNTLSPPGRSPSVDASWNAYRKNMLLTVGRALVCREHGVRFTPDVVRKSAIASWKNSSKSRRYRDAIMTLPKEESIRRAKEILSKIDKFIGSKVGSGCRYLSGHEIELWTLKTFIPYCRIHERVVFKPTKKGKK